MQDSLICSTEDGDDDDCHPGETLHCFVALSGTVLVAPMQAVELAGMNEVRVN